VVVVDGIKLIFFNILINFHISYLVFQKRKKIKFDLKNFVFNLMKHNFFLSKISRVFETNKKKVSNDYKKK
jgi:hypothetical protein